MRKSLMTLAGVGLIVGTVAIEMRMTTAMQDSDPAARKGHIHGGMVQKGREKASNVVQPGATTEDPPSLPPIATKGNAAAVTPEPGAATAPAAPAATGATDHAITPPVAGKGITQSGVRSPH